MRRTPLNRSALGSAATKVLVVLALLIASACSDDGGGTSDTTVIGSDTAAASTSAGTPGSTTIGPASTAGPVTTASASSATDPPPSLTTSTSVETVSFGQEWKPGCRNVVTTGGAVPSKSLLDSLTTLRALPASAQLDITVPRSPLIADNLVAGGPRDDAGYVFVAATRRGIVLGVNPSSMSGNASSMVTFIDHGGVRRWTRCVPERLMGVFASPTSSGPTPTGSVYIATLRENGDGPSSAAWQSLALTNGAPNDAFADAAEHAGMAVADLETYRVLEAHGDLVLLGRDRDTSITPTALALLDVSTGQLATPPLVSAAGPDGCGAATPYGFSVDGHLVARGPVVDGISPAVAVWNVDRWTNDPTALSALAMEVTFGCGPTALLRGVDGTGAPRWSRPELRQPGLEGVYIARDGDIAVMQVCAPGPTSTGASDDGICPTELVGIDARTGVTRWSLPGFREVPIGVNDGKFIANVGDTLSNDDATRGWAMFDAISGAALTGQRWDDPAAFQQGCCGEAEYFHAHVFGGVVIVISDDHVRVWFPADAPMALAASTLALP